MDSPNEMPNGEQPARSATGRRAILREVFLVRTGGLRSGWRLLLFLIFFFSIARITQFGLERIPAMHAWAQSQPRGTLTPYFEIFTESLLAATLFLAAYIMSRIEKRSFADYGLPVSEAFRRRFWLGGAVGFAEASLLMGLIGALRGFSLGTLAVGGLDILKYAALWGVGFLLVGFFEEFSFRGYLQHALASGIGFWPAALVLSLLFGAIHLQNPGEAWVGGLTAGLFGVLSAFALKRTGSLWFSVGMHATFDWSETFFYSVPDSGYLAQGKLLNSSFHGARWLTGGSVGPEGSIFAFLTLALSALVIHILFLRRQS